MIRILTYITDSTKGTKTGSAADTVHARMQKQTPDIRAQRTTEHTGQGGRVRRTEVRRMYHLERGYEAMEQRLEAIGAGVMMVEEDE